jgi:hypothetical protein
MNSKPSPILERNYGLETIPGLDTVGDIRSIFELNRGGVAILCRTDLQSRKVLMY